MKLKLALAACVVASMSGCAAFCDSADYGCINKQNAIANGIAAGGMAVLAGAAAYEASRPVYVAPVYVPPPVIVTPVYVCPNRWRC